MKDSKTRDTTAMGPPRLKLVPKESMPRAAEDAASDGAARRDDAADDAALLEDAEGVAFAEVSETSTLAAPAAGDFSSGGGDDAAAVAQDGSAASPSSDPVSQLAEHERRQKLRIIEAVLFAAPEPLDESAIAQSLIEGEDVAGLLRDLEGEYRARGIQLKRIAGKWAFRTADDLSFVLQRYAQEQRRLSKAALETLAIIAYHQPVTRAEIEEIRGVTTSAGTIDILLETGWIRPRGRRRAPGRPVTYGTTETFLSHFGLDSVRDLPGLAELKGSGLLDASLPPGFSMPEPQDVAALMPDELPLEDAEADAGEDAQGALAFDAADEGDEEKKTAGEGLSAGEAHAGESAGSSADRDGAADPTDADVAAAEPDDRDLDAETR